MQDAVTIERVAVKLKKLVGYGAKPDPSLISKCRVLADLVAEAYPEAEFDELPGLMCNELRQVFCDDTPNHQAVRCLLRIGDMDHLPNAEQARVEAMHYLKAEHSTQTWRKHYELPFLRERAAELVAYLKELGRLVEDTPAS